MGGCVIIIMVLYAAQCLGMRGYNFEDNKSKVPVSPDDGFLRIEMPGQVPAQLSVCIRFYPENTRFGDVHPMWNLFTPYNDRSPTYNLYCRSFAACQSEIYGYMLKKENNFPRRNWLRKWSSVCVGLDFLKNNITVSFNGELINRTDLERKRKEKGTDLQKSFSSGYFEGKHCHK